MNKSHVLKKLEDFKERLLKDVAVAYQDRGSDYGRERFSAWRRQVNKFLDESLPGSRAGLDRKLNHIVAFRKQNESQLEIFMREDGNPSIAFIDSLVIDIKNDEYDFSTTDKKLHQAPKKISGVDVNESRSVFIVHGHDEVLKVKVARFVEKMGYKAIILHEQASRGQTVIEKIESSADVGFAIVLYAEDDAGNSKKEAQAGRLNPRARQNVLFEHGYLIAKLGRARVASLVAGKPKLPSDVLGVVYIEDANWEAAVAKEMKAVGFSVDFNKLFGD